MFVNNEFIKNICGCKFFSITSKNVYIPGIFQISLFVGKEFSVVQKEVGDIIQGRILVGHAIHHDLQVKI